MTSDFNKTVDQFSQIDSYSKSWWGTFYEKEEDIQTARCWQFCRKINLSWKEYKKLSKEEEIAGKVAGFIRGSFTQHFGRNRGKIQEAQKMVLRLSKKLNGSGAVFCLTRYLENLQTGIPSPDLASTVLSSSSLSSPRFSFEPPSPPAFNSSRYFRSHYSCLDIGRRKQELLEQIQNCSSERDVDAAVQNATEEYERAKRIERNMLSWIVMQPTLMREYHLPEGLIHPNFNLEKFQEDVREKAESFVKLREENRTKIAAQYQTLLTDLGFPLSEPVAIPEMFLYSHYIDEASLKRLLSEQISKEILFYIPILSRKFTVESLADALRAHEGVQIRSFIEREVKEMILEEFKTFKMGHGGYSPGRDIPLFDSLYQYGRPFVYQGRSFGHLPRNADEFRIEVDPAAWANIVVE